MGNAPESSGNARPSNPTFRKEPPLDRGVRNYEYKKVLKWIDEITIERGGEISGRLLRTGLICAGSLGKPALLIALCRASPQKLNEDLLEALIHGFVQADQFANAFFLISHWMGAFATTTPAYRALTSSQQKAHSKLAASLLKRAQAYAPPATAGNVLSGTALYEALSKEQVDVLSPELKVMVEERGVEVKDKVRMAVWVGLMRRYGPKGKPALRVLCAAAVWAVCGHCCCMCGRGS